MDDLLTHTEKAESLFRSFIASLPNDPRPGHYLSHREEIEAISFENTFAIECYAEYANDLERWTVALATAKMEADQRGL